MPNENNSDEVLLNAMASDKINDMASDKINDMASDKINDMSSDKMNDMSSDSLENITDNLTFNEIQNLLEKEKEKTKNYEEQIKHVLADYQNLNRKIQSDVEKGVNTKIDEFILDFLKIYDDFLLAKEVYIESKTSSAGLNSILKNMDSLLMKYNVVSIDALGEIFDPNFHEAISITTDSELDDNTITKEIRKGYISHNRVIRPTLVEISKKMI